MRKAGILTLTISLGVAGLLLFVWLLGFGFALAGNLIHLLFLLALLIGIAGSLVGVGLLVAGAMRQHNADNQPPPPPPEL